MKRYLPTLLLVAVCIAGFWYASTQSFFKEKKDEPKQLINVKKDDVQSFTITAENGLIELQRKEGQWSMIKPSAVPLNTNLVESWIDSVNLVTPEKTIEDKAADISKYGLDKPTQSYQITLKDGSNQTLQIGESLPIQGYYYANLMGSAAVYQVGEQSLKTLDKAPIDFMEKSPVKLDYDKVTQVQVHWKAQNGVLNKVDVDKSMPDASWKLGDKQLKGAEASQLLDKLMFLSTDQLAKPAAQVTMNAPELKIDVKETEAGKDSVTSYVGKLDQDHVWVSKQGGEWAYAIPVTAIQELVDQVKR